MDSAIYGAIAGIITALIVMWGSRKTNMAVAENTQMQTLSALLKGLGVTVEDLLGAYQKIGEQAQKITAMETDFAAFKKKYGWIMGYFLANVEHMRRKGIEPLDPPEELKSDPDIVRIFGKK